MTLTTKQFGDACEHHVLARVAFAGHPAIKMPDGWPGYDLLTEDGQRISVKGLRYGNGQKAAWVNTDPYGDWDWLAAVRLHENTGEIETFLLPRSVVAEIGHIGVNRGHPAGYCTVAFTDPGIEPYRDNFALVG
jgi:hypothetical protein